MDLMKNKTTIYIAGAFFGALVGLAAAFLLEESAELDGDDLQLTRKKLSKIGIRTVSFLWSLSEKGKGKI